MLIVTIGRVKNNHFITTSSLQQQGRGENVLNLSERSLSG